MIMIQLLRMLCPLDWETMPWKPKSVSDCQNTRQESLKFYLYVEDWVDNGVDEGGVLQKRLDTCTSAVIYLSLPSPSLSIYFVFVSECVCVRACVTVVLAGLYVSVCTCDWIKDECIVQTGTGKWKGLCLCLGQLHSGIPTSTPPLRMRRHVRLRKTLKLLTCFHYDYKPSRYVSSWHLNSV